MTDGPTGLSDVQLTLSPVGRLLCRPPTIVLVALISCLRTWWLLVRPRLRWTECPPRPKARKNRSLFLLRKRGFAVCDMLLLGGDLTPTILVLRLVRTTELQGFVLHRLMVRTCRFDSGKL